MDNWARLSLYESTDIVRELYYQRHGRQLNASKAREIVSAVAQGREYFFAADDAGLLVRPLLQYYGVLSTSRALIMLLSRDLQESSLPQRHGLTAGAWGEFLTARDFRPEAINATANDGTFFSLLEKTQNADTGWVFTGPYPSRALLPRVRPVENISGFTFTLQQVLSRIPDLREIYERTFGISASNYRAFALMVSFETHTDIDIFEGHSGLPDQNALRAELAIPDGVQMIEQIPHNFLPSTPHLTYRLEHPLGLGIEQLPDIENEGECASIVAPFAQGVSLSRIGRLYLLSFFLGTLARYHPTTWLSIMQGRQSGDRLLPIVRESMNVIQRRFPTLLTGELEGMKAL